MKTNRRRQQATCHLLEIAIQKLPSRKTVKWREMREMKGDKDRERLLCNLISNGCYRERLHLMTAVYICVSCTRISDHKVQNVFFLICRIYYGLSSFVRDCTRFISPFLPLFPSNHSSDRSFLPSSHREPPRMENCIPYCFSSPALICHV